MADPPTSTAEHEYHPVDPDDFQMARTCAYYEKNVRDICDYGFQGGAQVVLCTLNRNLLWCGPGISHHRNGLSMADSERWDSLYKSGIAMEEKQQWREAIQAYRGAEGIDNQYAELLYRMGCCYMSFGDYAHAKELLNQSCERDWLHLRPSTRLAAIIEKISAENSNRKIFLADTSRAVEEQAPNGIPGMESFYDNVHPTFEANYAIAARIFTTIAQSLNEKMQTQFSSVPEPLSMNNCMQRLALTPWLRAKHIDEFLRLLPKLDIFLDLKKTVNGLKARQAEHLQRDAGPAQTLATYRAMLPKSQDDYRLRMEYAHLLQDNGMSQEALAEAQSLVADFPLRRDTRRLLGSLLAIQGKSTEAADTFKKLLAVYPEDVSGRAQLENLLHPATK